MNALARLVDRITPWLVEVGSWVLGGLLALNLVVISALITVGPVDRAVLIAVTALACALPLDVAGIILLRLIKDVQEIQLDDVTLTAFQEAHFPNIEAYFPAPRARGVVARRRGRITLAYALPIAVLSIALTLTGLVAGLWHMAAWAGEVFIGTVVLCAVLLVIVIAHSLPPESEAEKRLKLEHQKQRTSRRLENVK